MFSESNTVMWRQRRARCLHCLSPGPRHFNCWTNIIVQATIMGSTLFAQLASIGVFARLHEAVQRTENRTGKPTQRTKEEVTDGREAVANMTERYREESQPNYIKAATNAECARNMALIRGCLAQYPTARTGITAQYDSKKLLDAAKQSGDFSIVGDFVHLSDLLSNTRHKI